MIQLAFLWTAWCALHSLLISRKAHSYFRNSFGRFFGAYRILYILISIVTLVPVLWYQFSLPARLILPPGPALSLIKLLLLIYGLLMFYLGARVYDMSYFLGLAQWRNFRDNKQPAGLPFHTDGVLAYVRHPWYGAGIAFIWGFGSITDVYLLTRILLTGYFLIGTFLEEQRLKKELGEQYAAYCRKVPMLFPWKHSSLTKNNRMSIFLAL